MNTIHVHLSSPGAPTAPAQKKDYQVPGIYDVCRNMTSTRHSLRQKYVHRRISSRLLGARTSPQKKDYQVPGIYYSCRNMTGTRHSLRQGYVHRRRLPIPRQVQLKLISCIRPAAGHPRRYIPKTDQRPKTDQGCDTGGAVTSGSFVSAAQGRDTRKNDGRSNYLKR